MYLRGIGELTELNSTCWRLVYEQCGHSQELARLGIEDPRDADRYIRGGLTHCLSCQLGTRAAAPAD